MNEFVLNLDTDIFLFLNSVHSIYWDVVMKMATGKFVWVIMYGALVYAMWRTFGWRTTITMTLMAALTVTLADQISASVLRPMFERLRPSNLDNPISDMVHIVNGYRGGRYGFPSCHAANTFGVATLLALLFWRRRFSIFIFLWAIINCYSRIYLGVHYPGDLLAGVIVGSFCGFTCYIIGGFAVKIWRGNLRPRRHDFTIVTAYDGRTLKYHPIDLAITLGIVTIVYIFICATAIF